ncbi:MAG: hypothetical protein KA204_01700 [Chromatiaceae bacterium]|nr:hypothetical protein [Chromatiaceae bacterium]MBP6733801.1 hypothetical protein [Chromatiaceae bacterium]MBP6806757.1 hypothetical protein [Chromatiaceae bacterium]MBP8288439.1 hypothetical protein [Chromatiaceae bacterium]MBP9602680.1 hypothetical protein [Chromatiaceae bacterium]
MTNFVSKSLPRAIAAVLCASALNLTPAQAADEFAPLGPSATGTGQIATAYYIAEAEGGWQTYLNITNTGGSALAVKVRFKEYKNSREGLDFVVMLSPYDVWTASLSQNAAGQVIVNSTDNSCVAPLSMYNKFNNLGKTGQPGQAMLTQAFFGAADDGGSATAAEAMMRLVEGHVELIVMGQCDDTNSNRVTGQCFGPQGVPLPGQDSFAGIGYLTEHVDGVPRNCAVADSYFLAHGGTLTTGSAITNANGLPIAAGADGLNGLPAGYQGVNGNPLKVNVAYLDVGDGVGASVSALHFDSVIPANTNLVTAQQYPWNLEPTIATAPSGQLWNISALLNFEQAITWTDTTQEWSINPVAGVKTSMIFNFPTKGYHVDQTCNELYASNNRWRNDGANLLACADAADVAFLNGIVAGKDYSPIQGTGNFDGTRNGASFPPSIAPFRDRWASGKSDVQFWFWANDREEKFVNETQVSPGREKWVLPWEVAQIVFDETGGALGFGAPAQVYIPAAAALDATNGWIDVALDFTNTFSTTGVRRGYDALQGVDAMGYAFAGLPVQGIMIKTRDLGVPGTAYGQGNDNGFKYCQYDPAPGAAIPVSSGANATSGGWACTNPNP